MRGDLKVVYDSVMNFGEMDVYSGLKLLLDAEYYLYNKKDVEKYCLYMEKYFAGLGEGIVPKIISGRWSRCTRYWGKRSRRKWLVRESVG